MPTALPAQPSSSKTRLYLITVAILLIAAFLLGFVPQYRKASELQTRFDQLQREARMLRTRDLASLLYLEVSRKNYGIAAQHATAFFSNVRGMLSDNPDPSVKVTLENIAGQADTITANIAKADATVETSARDIMDRMHQLTVR